MIHKKYIFTCILKKGNPAETKSCKNLFLPVANLFRSTLTMGGLQGLGAADAPTHSRCAALL